MARKELWSWLKTLAIAIILALVIRQYVFAFYVVDGSSMVPTLKDGQIVLVSKISYRLGSFHRGDIAVFETEKSLTGMTVERDLIKRIIALPGDTIAIKGGKIILNGVELSEDYTDIDLETDMEPVLIEDDTVFVMGDNRHPRGSWDSREFGPVPFDTIIGRAIVIIFPLPKKIK